MFNSLAPLSTDIVASGYEVLYQFVRLMGLVGLVNRNYAGTPAFVGETLTVPALNYLGKAKVVGPEEPVVPDPLSGVTVEVKTKRLVASFRLDNLIRLFSQVDLRTQGALLVAQAMIEGVDDYLFSFWPKIYQFVGATDGSKFLDPATNNLINLSKARALLTQNKVPRDGSWRGVINAAEEMNFGATPLVLQAQQAGTNRNQAELLPNNLGYFHNFNLSTSQAVPGGIQLANAAVWNNPNAKMDGIHAIGVAIVNLKGLGANKTIPKGSIFKFKAKNYSVIADAVTDGTGDAAGVGIFPKLRDAAADNDLVTGKEFPNPISIMPFFHPNAWLFVNRPPAEMLDNAGTRQQLITDTDAGITMRVSVENKVVDPVAGFQEYITFDAIIAGDIVRPEMILRGHGESEPSLEE